MENTDKGFYDYESERYSEKRYEGVTESYTQFLFKNRRKIVTCMISKLVQERKDLSLLDIACADGVISGSLDKSFPGVFSKIVGTDISTGMIAAAKKKFSINSRFSFFIKNECPIERFDLALGLGYLSMPILDEEITFLKKRLKKGGYYICTLTSNNSLFAYFKLRNSPLLPGYVTYPTYEKFLLENFEILKSIPSGFFIPKLWSVPFLARFFQHIAEKICKPLFPNLFHEKIYLLRLK